MNAPAPLSAEGLAVGHKGRALIHDLTFALAMGSITCLLGRNGAGKTTLFRALLGLQPVMAGRILMSGQNITELGRAAIARKVALVPQGQDMAFPFTVMEVVLMGRTIRIGAFAAPSVTDEAAVVSALERLGIADFRKRTFNTLSGGERQLVLIARALAQETGLILMDEPTASLDLAHRALVLSTIRALASDGISVLFSTHEPAQALEIADHALLVGPDGQVSAGAARDVITAQTLSQAYGAVVEMISVGADVLLRARQVNRESPNLGR